MAPPAYTEEVSTMAPRDTAHRSQPPRPAPGRTGGASKKAEPQPSGSRRHPQRHLRSSGEAEPEGRLPPAAEKALRKKRAVQQAQRGGAGGVPNTVLARLSDPPARVSQPPAPSPTARTQKKEDKPDAKLANKRSARRRSGTVELDKNGQLPAGDAPADGDKAQRRKRKKKKAAADAPVAEVVDDPKARALALAQRGHHKTSMAQVHRRPLASRWQRTLAADLLGLSLCALGILAGLSLLSYHPGDPGLTVSPSSDDGVHNWIGPVGALLADGLTLLLGLFAFLMPAFLVMGGLAFLRSRVRMPRLRQLAGFLVLASGAVLLLEVTLGAYDALPFPPGGLAGVVLGAVLLPLLYPLGTGIVGTVVLAAGIMVALDKSVAHALDELGLFATRARKQLKERVGVWWETRRLLEEEYDRLEEELRAQALLDEEAAEQSQMLRRERIAQAAEAKALEHVGQAIDPAAEAPVVVGAVEAAPADDDKPKIIADAREPAPAIIKAPLSAEPVEAVDDATPATRAKKKMRKAPLAELPAHDSIVEVADEVGGALPSLPDLPPPPVLDDAALDLSAASLRKAGHDPAWVDAGLASSPPALPTEPATDALGPEATPAPTAPSRADKRLMRTSPNQARPDAELSSDEGGTTTERQQVSKRAAPPAGPVADAAADDDASGLRIVEREEDEVSLDEDDPTVPDQEVRYERPPLRLLDYDAPDREPVDEQKMLAEADKLVQKFKDFGIEGRVREVRPGPVVTTYEFVPAPGIKVSRIAALSDDIAMAMEAVHVRIVAPIPGKGAVGIEIPNDKRETVYLKEIIASERFKGQDGPLVMALGKDIEGKPYTADLGAMPHVLVSGTTGSGKSVSVNAMICSLLYRSSPEDVKLLMIDPKMLELSVYDGIPHLLLPPIIDSKKAANALAWAVGEMERRYQQMSELGVRDIAGFNEMLADIKSGDGPEGKTIPKDDTGKPFQKLPYIVIVVDEYADLLAIAGKEVEGYVMRLAQKARAAGLHVMLATQRPSVDVITGVIKANFPVRMGFRLASSHDSKTIINRPGAEKLLGRGDMLIMPPGTSNVTRVHGAFISEKELHRVVAFLKGQGEPNYDMSIVNPPRNDGDHVDAGDEERDAKWDEALRVVAKSGRCSTSWLQRQLGIGYNRAARIVEMMEREGLVGPQLNSKGDREIFINPSD
jgi:S-DNA-T family DNA segregation ATPase FtsK/SpoIIIE